LKRGVDAWNDWRAKHRDVQPQLNGADLQKAQLAGVQPGWANLYGINLSGANLNDAESVRF